MKKRKMATQPAVSGKRFEIGFQILSQWLYLKQNGKTLILFFEDNFIGSIAIYGMGVLGERFYQELKDSEIKIDYAIDRFADLKNKPWLTCYGLDEEHLPDTDAIVVTPVQDYWAIVELLERKTDVPILSLQDIVDYCAAGD